MTLRSSPTPREQASSECPSMRSKLLPVGVLGGMGPLAGVHFARRMVELTPAGFDQDHIPFILWSDPAIPDRSAALDGRGPSPLAAMRSALQGLVAAGAGVIAMPCNTAHAWHGALSETSPVPILHIAEATVDTVRTRGTKRVGVLCTHATSEMRLYQDALDKRGLESVLPTDEEFESLVMPAIWQVKAGELDPAGYKLRLAAQKLILRGADALILGCTEIPIVLPDSSILNTPLCSSVDALAHAAIYHATSHSTAKGPFKASGACA